MPLFKGVASKSTPNEAIRYVTDEKKAACVSVRNLFEDEDYAEQFKQTMARFHKGKKYNERKYYHFKLSCARGDNVSAQESQLFAEELTARLFRDYECVIATHTDTQTVHSHIVVNAINPLSGKKLRITKTDYTEMKDEANRLGKEMGFSELDFRKKARHNRTREEKQIILKGGTSWKEELREVIEEAKQVTMSEIEFIEHLQKYGVKITRSGKDYSYLHPQKQKPIRGAKLGENYTKREVNDVISKQRNGSTGVAVDRITTEKRNSQGANGQRLAQRSVGDIQREMQQLDRTAELARRGLETGSELSKEQQRRVSNQSDGCGGKDAARLTGNDRVGETVQKPSKSRVGKSSSFNSK